MKEKIKIGRNAFIVIVSLLLIIIIFSLGPKLLNSFFKEKILIEQESTLRTSAIKLFKNNETDLPKEIGETKKVYLNLLKYYGYSDDIFDSSDKPCNTELSYVEVKKVSEEQYEYYPFLVCDNYNTVSTWSDWSNPDTAKPDVEEDKDTIVEEELVYNYVKYISASNEWSKWEDLILNAGETKEDKEQSIYDYQYQKLYSEKVLKWRWANNNGRKYADGYYTSAPSGYPNKDTSLKKTEYQYKREIKNYADDGKYYEAGKQPSKYNKQGESIAEYKYKRANGKNYYNNEEYIDINSDKGKSLISQGYKIEEDTKKVKYKYKKVNKSNVYATGGLTIDGKSGYYPKRNKPSGYPNTSSNAIWSPWSSTYVAISEGTAKLGSEVKFRYQEKQAKYACKMRSYSSKQLEGPSGMYTIADKTGKPSTWSSWKTLVDGGSITATSELMVESHKKKYNWISYEYYCDSSTMRVDGWTKRVPDNYGSNPSANTCRVLCGGSSANAWDDCKLNRTLTLYGAYDANYSGYKRLGWAGYYSTVEAGPFTSGGARSNNSTYVMIYKKKMYYYFGYSSYRRDSLGVNVLYYNPGSCPSSTDQMDYNNKIMEFVSSSPWIEASNYSYNSNRRWQYKERLYKFYKVKETTEYAGGGSGKYYDSVPSGYSASNKVTSESQTLAKFYKTGEEVTSWVREKPSGNGWSQIDKRTLYKYYYLTTENTKWVSSRPAGNGWSQIDKRTSYKYYKKATGETEEYYATAPTGYPIKLTKTEKITWSDWKTTVPTTTSNNYKMKMQVRRKSKVAQIITTDHVLEEYVSKEILESLLGKTLEEIEKDPTIDYVTKTIYKYRTRSN